MPKSSRLRVAMLLENNYYPRDPRVRREAECLAAAGFSVTVICPGTKGQAREESINHVDVVRFPAPREAQGTVGYIWEYGYSLVATLGLLFKLAVREGIDVIHAANPPDLFVLVAACFKPFGVKFVYDQHDLAPEMYQERFSGGSSRLIHSILLLLERWSYRLADHIVVTNASYRDNAVRRGHAPAPKISIVRNGPDEAQLQYRAGADSSLLRPGAVTLAYLGLMGRQDGVDYLIRALHHLRADLGRSDFYCLLVGTGEEQPGLQEMARTLGLASYVRFTGFVPSPDFMKYLLAADICLDPDPSSPYNDKSTMLKVMDYMAAAKPIVAFDLPETRQSAGDAAIYARANSELAFAEAIAYLMDSPREREARGESGRLRVERELSWQRSAEILLRAYSTLGSPQQDAVAAGTNPV